MYQLASSAERNNTRSHLSALIRLGYSCADYFALKNISVAILKGLRISAAALKCLKFRAATLKGLQILGAILTGLTVCSNANFYPQKLCTKLSTI